MRVVPRWLVVSCAIAILASACSSQQTPQTPTAPTPQPGPPGGNPNPTPPDNPPSNQPPPPTPSGQTGRLAAVGDIGECGSRAVEATARLAANSSGEIVLAGDLAYMHGSMQDFIRCFEPFWGILRGRLRPVPGNHEYETPGAAGYFQYFGAPASPGGRSFYSFQSGDWLVLMLDSNLPTRVGSPQYEFVSMALEQHRNPCAMAVWHHPLFSSGPNGPNVFMRDIWRLLYERRADVVIAAHDHFYERFGKQDVDGRSDAAGLRQFIVGSGGARLYDFLRMTANSQDREKAHGVLRMTLHFDRYEWTFVDISGNVLDMGSDGCH